MSNQHEHNHSGMEDKKQSNTILSAILIGFLIGILIYSAAKNTWGLVTLIPLFLIYRLMKKD